jgi:uncharacterized protein
MELEPLMIAGLIAAGVGIATVAMAVGIGGGILWTPLLIVAYDLGPAEAVATSLLIQVVGLGSGTVAYLRYRLVVPRLSLLFSLVALPGVVLGSFFSVAMPQHLVQMALGAMALTLAILFVASQDEVFASAADQGARPYDPAKVNTLLPIPAFFGVIMGLLSVGIGEWIIPALKSRLRMEMSRAIGTVIPMMFLLALTATAAHWIFSENFRLEHSLWGALGTLIGGQIGPLINRRIEDRLLKEAFIYLMTLVGIHLIFQSV